MDYDLDETQRLDSTDLFPVEPEPRTAAEREDARRRRRDEFVIGDFARIANAHPDGSYKVERVGGAPPGENGILGYLPRGDLGGLALQEIVDERWGGGTYRVVVCDGMRQDIDHPSASCSFRIAGASKPKDPPARAEAVPAASLPARRESPALVEMLTAQMAENITRDRERQQAEHRERMAQIEADGRRAEAEAKATAARVAAEAELEKTRLQIEANEREARRKDEAAERQRQFDAQLELMREQRESGAASGSAFAEARAHLLTTMTDMQKMAFERRLDATHPLPETDDSWGGALKSFVRDAGPQLVQTVADVVEQRRGGSPAAPPPADAPPALPAPPPDQLPVPAPEQQPAAAAPPPQFDPRAEVARRVTAFVDRLAFEISIESDPEGAWYAGADTLEDGYRRLPRQLREALSVGGWAAFETHLAAEYPPVASIRQALQTPTGAAWFAEWFACAPWTSTDDDPGEPEESSPPIPHLVPPPAPEPPTDIAPPSEDPPADPAPRTEAEAAS